MTSFRLNAVPAIESGPGAMMRLKKRARDGVEILIVADPAMVEFEHLPRLVAALEEGGATVSTFTDIVSDPKEASVNAAVQEFGAKDIVIALGGGSTMDAAKIIAALLGTGEDCTAYRLATKRMPARRCTLIAVPTTAGTGSEATNISVLTSDDGVKYWYAGRGQEPDQIVIDPELMVGLPAFLTAATGCDALVHAIEASTSVIASSGNDIYAHEAIRLCLKRLPHVVDNPGDLEARADMAYAATLGGIAINNGGTAMAHAVGHALSSLSPMHHGLSVTAGLGAALPVLVKDSSRFDAIADLFGVKSKEDLPKAFDDFVESTKLSFKHDTSGVSVSAFAEQILKPENKIMFDGAKLEDAQSHVNGLAERTLAYFH